VKWTLREANRTGPFELAIDTLRPAASGHPVALGPPIALVVRVPRAKLAQARQVARGLASVVGGHAGAAAHLLPQSASRVMTEFLSASRTLGWLCMRLSVRADEVRAVLAHEHEGADSRAAPAAELRQALESVPYFLARKPSSGEGGRWVRVGEPRANAERPGASMVDVEVRLLPSDAAAAHGVVSVSRQLSSLFGKWRLSKPVLGDLRRQTETVTTQDLAVDSAALADLIGFVEEFQLSGAGTVTSIEWRIASSTTPTGAEPVRVRGIRLVLSRPRDK
jgi:hypothetical protein